MDFVKAAAFLFAQLCDIKPTGEQVKEETIRSLLSDLVVPPFTPKENKASR